MLLPPHILFGAAIGSKIASPAAVFSLSFIGHYLLDILPHYEYKIPGLKGKGPDKKIISDLIKLAADLCFGGGIALLLIWSSPFRTTAIIGMLSSLLPDALLFLYWRHPQSKFLKIFAIPHRTCHYLKNLSPAWLSLSSEIIVTFAILSFLYYSLYAVFRLLSI